MAITIRTLRLALVLVAVLTSPPASGRECMELTGQWPFGPASAVALAGSRAYLGSGSALVVCSMEQPVGMEILGSLPLPGLVRAIDI